jgi:hypothetical protein
LNGQGLKINVVCGRSAGEENTAAKPTEKAKNNIICCTTPINPPAQRITRVTATEGRITHSGRYVTPVHPPPQNFGVISIECSATESVPSDSKGPIYHSHRVKKAASRFLGNEVETKVTSSFHKNLSRSIAAQNWMVNIKMESQKKLKVDLVAEKDLQAKAMEQFLMWKG